MEQALHEMPLGFSMNLAMDAEALAAFGRLPRSEQNAVIERSRRITDKDEMKRLIRSLCR
ncbi:MAG: hypothetical protein LUC87_08465 [Clostridiales bacterium]|nr:hypothetical protein [Clostridiales bacterium]MCD8367570.1 hypothetical protein [Clostridiales bacterium]